MTNFNPELKKFLDENPNITVMGIFWAGYWRLIAVIMGVYLAFALFAALVN